MTFGPAYAPVAAFGYRKQRFGVNLAYGQGNSSPTLREFRTNDGRLNGDLRPERGESFELQAYRAWEKGTRVSINAYWARLSQTITSFLDSSDVQQFRNAGATRQPGVELNLFVPLNWQGLETSVAYAFQPYRYEDYTVGETSFAERPLPGLPEHSLDLLLSWRPGSQAGSGLSPFSTLNVRYESATPLDDAGLVEAEAFVLFRAQAGLQYRRWENLSDLRYSLGNDINPEFGRRYFQPAPGRSFSVTLRLLPKNDFR